MFLKFLLKLTASNGNNNPDWEIAIQEKGLSGFARHVMDFHSIFLIGSSNSLVKTDFASYYLKLNLPYVS